MTRLYTVFDTNVLLDVLCNREPFAAPARELWSRVAAGTLRGGIVATSVTNVFYITRKARDLDTARRAVADLLLLFDVCPVGRDVLEAARVGPLADYEDAVQLAASTRAGADLIVTRDPRGFAGSRLRVVDPATLARELSGGSAPTP